MVQWARGNTDVPISKKAAGKNPADPLLHTHTHISWWLWHFQMFTDNNKVTTKNQTVGLCCTSLLLRSCTASNMCCFVRQMQFKPFYKRIKSKCTYLAYYTSILHSVLLNIIHVFCCGHQRPAGYHCHLKIPSNSKWFLSPLPWQKKERGSYSEQV